MLQLALPTSAHRLPPRQISKLTTTTTTATANATGAAAATTVTATIVEPVGPENLVVGKTVSSVAAAAAGRLRLQLAAGYKYFGNVAQTL